MRMLISTCLLLIISCGCAQVGQTHKEVPPPPAPMPVKPPEKTKTEKTRLLLARLDSGEYRKREEAAEGLQKLLDSKSGEVLAVLQHEHAATEDPEVRNRLERMLAPYTRWHITPAVLDAIPNIIELLEEKTRKRMRTAIEGLRKLDPKDSRGVLLTVMRECQNGRRRAVEALVENADLEVIEFFVGRLELETGKHGWPHYSKYALTRIGKASIKPVAKLLYETDNGVVRGFAADILGHIGGKANHILLEATGSEKPLVIASALRALYFSPEITAPSEALLRHIKSEYNGVRWAAARLLGRTKDPRAFGALLSSLEKDKDCFVRSATAEALAETGDKRAVPVLIKALKDGDWPVRNAAARALRHFRDKQAIRPLIDALDDPELSKLDSFQPFVALKEFGKSAVPQLLEAYKTAKPSVRTRLIELLWSAGDAQSIPLLVQALNDDSGEIRRRAAKGLGVLKAKGAIDALIAALNDGEAGVRTSAVEALGEIGDKRAVDSLIRELSDHRVPLEENYAPACSAAIALGKIGAKRAFGPIVKELKRLPTGYIWDIVLLPWALARTGGKDAIPHLIELFDTELYCGEQDDFRDAIGKAILRFGEMATSALLEAAKSDQPHLKAGALQTLAMLREPKAFDLLLEALNDKNLEVRRVAAGAISLFKDTRALKPLIALLGDSNPHVRKVASSSLGYLRDRRAVEPLIKLAMEHHYYDDGVEATCALGRIGDEAVIESLVLLLLEDKDEIRAAAALSLGAFKDKRAVDALIRALEDNDEDVFEAAANSLVEIGDKRAIKSLKSLLKSNFMELRMAAAVALLQFGDKDAEKLVREALRSKKYMNPGYAAEALGKLGGENASTALVEMLGSGDSHAREQAIVALAQLKDQRVLGKLIELLASDDDDDVREAAHDALGKITGRNFGWNWQAWRRWHEKQKAQEPSQKER